jgi:hypothetical protein
VVVRGRVRVRIGVRIGVVMRGRMRVRVTDAEADNVKDTRDLLICERAQHSIAQHNIT